jgi:hypothetical protein
MEDLTSFKNGEIFANFQWYLPKISIPSIEIFNNSDIQEGLKNVLNNPKIATLLIVDRLHYQIKEVFINKNDVHAIVWNKYVLPERIEGKLLDRIEAENVMKKKSKEYDEIEKQNIKILSKNDKLKQYLDEGNIIIFGIYGYSDGYIQYSYVEKAYYFQKNKNVYVRTEINLKKDDDKSSIYSGDSD